eukprot:GHVL01016780.1.p1 GENE.GHVL01016780.1~~GHVL01016780.1.p1  ORF type:complete len:120 (+),score=2.53 GHVL01016780.1:722-1081(+)
MRRWTNQLRVVSKEVAHIYALINQCMCLFIYVSFNMEDVIHCLMLQTFDIVLRHRNVYSEKLCVNLSVRFVHFRTFSAAIHRTTTYSADVTVSFTDLECNTRPNKRANLTKTSSTVPSP